MFLPKTPRDWICLPEDNGKCTEVFSGLRNNRWKFLRVGVEIISNNPTSYLTMHKCKHYMGGWFKVQRAWIWSRNPLMLSSTAAG